MDFSERHLSQAARHEVPNGPQVANRLLADLPLYRKWESSHRGCMVVIANQGRKRQRVEAMRRVALLAVHRKAPFDYMRGHRVHGAARHLLVRALFGDRDYASCVVGEHEAWLVSTGSLLCTDALCRELMGDAPFAEALVHYAAAYAEYYGAYCSAQVATMAGQATALQPLLPYLRHQLRLVRDHLLAGAPEKSDYAALTALHAATGTTQPLPVLAP